MHACTHTCTRACTHTHTHALPPFQPPTPHLCLARPQQAPDDTVLPDRGQPDDADSQRLVAGCPARARKRAQQLQQQVASKADLSRVGTCVRKEGGRADGEWMGRPGHMVMVKWAWSHGHTWLNGLG
eukprot:356327-Chlamydomonas_euryale.AAC.3